MKKYKEKIKAVFFDVDGTLFSHKSNQIPDSAKHALAYLKENGVLLFIASGRHILEINEMLSENLENLGFEGYVTLNGQYCYNKNHIIYQKPIEQQDIINLVRELQQNPFPCGFFEEHCKYINFVNPAVKKIYQRMASPLLETGDPNRGYIHPVYQISVYDTTKEKDEYLQRLMPHCRLSRWSDLAVDLFEAQGSKRKGIEAVLRYYSIRPEETMAFGDAVNDIEMLQFSGVGIAMGNAKDEVKRHADDVTDDADHDGIYKALEKYGML